MSALDPSAAVETATGQPDLRRPWVMWLLFFFQFASVGVYFTFVNVYYRQFGLSGTQIGVMGMTSALISMGAGVVWGIIADRTGKPRLLIALGAVLTLVNVQFIPSMTSFQSIFLLACLGGATLAAPFTLVDSVVLSLLGARREEYGSYRLGGTLGFLITGFGAGFVLERTGLGLIFPAFGVFMLAFAVTALLLPDAPLKARTRGAAGLGAMVRQPAWILFIVCVFLCWMGANAVISFLSVSLKEMGATQSLIGVASTIGAVTELPFMFFSARLLKRFGPIRLLLAGIFLTTIRLALFGIMPSPEWAVAINMLNGPAYVFFWNSAVTHANRMAPGGLANTAQGLLAAALSLAGVVSSFLAGWLFDLLGPKGIFLVMAGFSLLALLLFVAGNWKKLRAE